MNYELAICFLFILLFFIYFYIRKQPILEGAKNKSDDPFKKMDKFFKKIPKDIQKIPKETKKGFNKAKKETEKGLKKAEKATKKGFDKATKEMNKVKNGILGPLNKWANQMKNFFKNLGRLFDDWAKFIRGNIMCGITNISTSFCLIWNMIRLVGLIIYGIIWLIIYVFMGESMANSYDCFVIKIQDFFWKFASPSLKTKINKCNKGCSSEIPIWGGKKMKSPAENARSKCNAKTKSDDDDESGFTLRVFYWIVLALFVGYKLFSKYIDITVNTPK
jgi:hypothetical protein